MNLDFSLSIEDWVAYVKRFFDIIVSFLDFIGIKLFTDSGSQGESDNASDDDE